MISKTSILSALENIYISPAEICNLNCRLCYTHKTKNILSNQQILDFINNYQAFIQSRQFLTTLNAAHSPEKKIADEKINADLKSILFCGGEVFILPEFTQLINQLVKRKIFVTIITNGTVDKLNEIENPQNCQLLVSIDGPKEIHDQNRGNGNFDKSTEFIKHAQKLGFPVEVMFLITKESYPFKDSFPKKFPDLKFNYITQKTIFYTENHPLSNQNNQKPALNSDQIIDIKKNYPSIPAKNFGCFQLSLQSNGQIYGCCESPASLGLISDDPNIYIENFLKSLNTCQKCQIKTDADNVFLGAQSSESDFTSDEGASTSKKSLSSQFVCNGCCCPDFLCGYKKELNQINCKEVVKLFN